jgi:ankyrin repeat protein
VLGLQHRAAAAGHTHVVKYLLEHGVDPNCRKSKAKTPLHEAAAGGHGAVIEVLLAQVSSNLAAKAQRTSRGAEHFMLTLLKVRLGWCAGRQGALISAHKTNGWTPLMYSCMKGDAHSARLVRARRQSTSADSRCRCQAILYSHRTAVLCVHHINCPGRAVLDACSCSDTVRISATETATVRPPCISRVEKVIALWLSSCWTQR